MPSLSDRKIVYPLDLNINGRLLRHLLISHQYRSKHPDMSDEIIVDLARTLDGQRFDIEAERDGFEYFKAEPVYRNDRPYRLVLVICATNDYLGVVNAFRVKKGFL